MPALGVWHGLPRGVVDDAAGRECGPAEQGDEARLGLERGARVLLVSSSSSSTSISSSDSSRLVAKALVAVVPVGAAADAADAEVDDDGRGRRRRSGRRSSRSGKEKSELEVELDDSAWNSNKLRPVAPSLERFRARAHVSRTIAAAVLLSMAKGFRRPPGSSGTPVLFLQGEVLMFLSLVERKKNGRVEESFHFSSSRFFTNSPSWASLSVSTDCLLGLSFSSLSLLSLTSGPLDLLFSSSWS